MRKHYSRIRKEMVVLIVCTMMLAAAIGFVISSSAAEEPAWDTCYELANTHISWQQTFYPGPGDLVEGR